MARGGSPVEEEDLRKTRAQVGALQGLERGRRAQVRRRPALATGIESGSSLGFERGCRLVAGLGRSRAQNARSLVALCAPCRDTRVKNETHTSIHASGRFGLWRRRARAPTPLTSSSGAWGGACREDTLRARSLSSRARFFFFFFFSARCASGVGPHPSTRAPASTPNHSIDSHFVSLTRFYGTFPVRFGLWTVPTTRTCPVALQNAIDRTLEPRTLSLDHSQTPHVESSLDPVVGRSRLEGLCFGGDEETLMKALKMPVLLMPARAPRASSV